MKVIHICSYFYTSKIYKKLCEELSKHNIDQYIYVPLRKDFNKKETSSVEGYELVHKKSLAMLIVFFILEKKKNTKGFFLSVFLNTK